MNELFQTNCEIQYEKSQDTEYLTDNPDRRCPNISLAKKDLGYDPVVDLKTGLRNSLIWYSENK
jgi:dTDP-glucose 4,6-dehydratase/UDP-glucuronate decarboxylase